MNEKHVKRVVVTGVGLVSPLAANSTVSWERLLKGLSGVKRLPLESYGDCPVSIAGIIPSYEDDPIGGLDMNRYIPLKEQKKADRFIQLALVAAEEAINDANLLPLSDDEKLDIATIVATGIGGFHSITNAVNTVATKGSRKLSPFTIPSFIANLAAGQISIKYGFKGMIGAPVSACAASIQAIGDGFRAIQSGYANIALVGGSESCINNVSLGGFHAARALTTNYNDAPECASRPFDSQRDGFVMSEGAGILILEDLDNALKRNAKILAEIIGYGTTSDAWHITSGPEDGSGAARSMQKALNDAHLKAEDIDYINAHSTSTFVGDRAEIAAIKSVFNSSKNYISSTKSSTGHMLGAAGVAATIFSIKAINDGIAPPSINIDDLDDSADGLNIITNTPKETSLKNVLINGFGFGGVNASLIISDFVK
ncbi:beta-ketoacyl-ACP synthase II [Pantoea anthophila]|jgi:3-oxoacyl-[acyl-carrier-protein] synthase II|uniref:beta-ketoacyl-ACP synthase II n=1 Tax=Pantoea anthophila TaxID=470931 RepID=UPI002DBEECEF|nr:beta-ketoacyl-ACP synthase II [Pantoea anthophila]MEB5708403.1 beta-ketoacyl-ACP synthase II [Pantoea anthophila]MEB6519279.1 beta-ketoacyl-ACP synthase II [Pantoea anthophila]